MSTIVERAVAGHMKSMQELYEANKKELYTFCCFVLRNAGQARSASENVISEIWARAKDKQITEESDFRKLMILCAARQCRKLLFGKDPGAFRLTRVSAFTPQTILNEEFSGDVTKGTNELFDILDKIAAPKKFVFLVRTIGDLSEKQVAEIIGQREEVVRYDYSTTASELRVHLNGAVTPAKIVSLFKQASEMAVCPENMDKNCTAMMESRAVSDLPPKKVMIGVGVGVVVLIGILIAVFASGNSEPVNNTTDLSGDDYYDFSYDDYDDSYNEDELSSAIQTPEVTIDTSLTYYADITIKDYGTITVLLDDETAPITVGNFVTLAESGFYDGLTFHRIMDGFMMQGGDPNGDGTGGSETNIFGEFTSNGYDNPLSHTAGAISMARSSAYDSASSQFFIVHEDSTFLDGEYAVFGYVTDDAGMAIVNAVCSDAQPTDDNGTIPADEQPVITSVIIRTEGEQNTETEADDTVNANSDETTGAEETDITIDDENTEDTAEEDISDEEEEGAEVE